MADEEMTVGDALALAIGHQKAGQLREAEAVYSAILQADPQNAVASHNMGLIALRTGRTAIARTHLETAVRLQPEMGRFRNSLGDAYRALGRYAEAVAMFEQASALSPADAAPHNNRGAALAALGRLDEAEAAFREALAISPGAPSALSNLANCLQALGRRDEAVATFRQALEADPADLNGARLALASLGVGEAAARASDAQLDRLYTLRSGTWDADPSYRGAALVAQALSDRLTPPADILDVGCGTGLVGALLKSVTGELVGVDLSAAMLKAAADKGVYTALHQRDLMDFLGANPGRFDAVACAAVLIHFGDLRPPFDATCGALKAGGLFALTLFPNQADPDSFAPGAMTGWAQGGLFTHGRAYVARTAVEAGFEVLALDDEVHEQSERGPVTGLVVVLRRPT